VDGPGAAEGHHDVLVLRFGSLAAVFAAGAATKLSFRKALTYVFTVAIILAVI
jgi:hypothetical protein